MGRRKEKEVSVVVEKEKDSSLSKSSSASNPSDRDGGRARGEADVTGERDEEEKGGVRSTWRGGEEEGKGSSSESMRDLRTSRSGSADDAEGWEGGEGGSDVMRDDGGLGRLGGTLGRCGRDFGEGEGVGDREGKEDERSKGASEMLISLSNSSNASIASSFIDFGAT